jgi:hypothetical protein
MAMTGYGDDRRRDFLFDDFPGAVFRGRDLNPGGQAGEGTSIDARAARDRPPNRFDSSESGREIALGLVPR